MSFPYRFQWCLCLFLGWFSLAYAGHCVYRGKDYQFGETIALSGCRVCECAKNCTFVCYSTCCEYDGKFFKEGDIFHKSECRQCTCNRGGKLKCREACVSKCRVYGDPHIVTFDGSSYTFQGTCKYTYVQDIENSEISVELQHTQLQSLSGILAALPDRLFVRIKKLNLELRQEGTVLADGNKVKIPFYHRKDGSRISLTKTEGNKLLLESPNSGLTIVWSIGQHFLEVHLKKIWNGKVGGLCGNNDGDRTNDFQYKSETNLTAAEFGNKWKTQGGSDLQCSSGFEQVDACKVAGAEVQAMADKDCRAALFSKAFSKCHQLNPPEAFFQNCLYDICASKNPSASLCDSLANYASTCETSGVTLGNWHSSLDICACPPLKNVENGEYYPPTCTTSAQKAGSECELSCEGDRQAFGTIKMKCTDNGWQSVYGKIFVPPTCLSPPQIASQIKIDLTESLNDSDMIYVLDESQSIGGKNFEKEIAFVSNMMKRFPVTKKRSTSVITFSSVAKVQIRLGEVSGDCEFQRKLSQVEYSAGGTNIQNALNAAIKEVERKKNKDNPTFIFLLSDGVGCCEPHIPAEILKKMGCTIFTIGVGGYSRKQLLSLASPNKAGIPYFYGISDFAVFDQISTLIRPESVIELCSDIGGKCESDSNCRNSRLVCSEKGKCEERKCKPITHGDHQLRLVGGRGCGEGRLEIHNGKRWGHVCRDNWDIAEAYVACLSLGFQYVERTNYETTFKLNEETPMLLGSVRCQGYEPFLSQCASTDERSDIQIADGDNSAECFSPTPAGVLCESPKSSASNSAASHDNKGII